MDKQSRINKIIQTVVWSIAILIVIFLSANFFSALFEMDDELMFIFGFTLMALTCTTVLILIFSGFISSVWETKGKDKEKLGK